MRQDSEQVGARPGEGRNWAITSGGRGEPDYIEGEKCDTAEAAVAAWRHLRHLWFIEATARRTTPEEDAMLAPPLTLAASRKWGGR